MDKPEKRRKKHLTGKTVLLCLFLIFFVYIGINFMVNSGGSLTTYMAREGELDESFTVDGFIFKNQKVLYAPEDGYIECAVEESGRVGKNGIIAYIYENDAPINVKNRIREIEDKLKELSENDRSISASENDSIRLEQDVSEKITEIAALVRDNDMEGLLEIKDELNEIVEARRRISGDGKSNQEIEEELKAEKAELEKKYDMTRLTISTDTAGSFTARIDGLEEVLDGSKVEEITQSYLSNIKAGDESDNSESKVKKGSPIGKVVDTYSWYFAATVEKDMVNSLNPGDSVRLKFLDSSDNIIDGSVYQISDENEGKAVLIIKSAGYVDNLYSMSMARVEVIKKTHEGMRIPAKAIRVNDGKKGVYILSGNKVKFREAKVYYMNEEWAVVSRDDEKGLKLYDSVVVGGSNIYEGKVVR